MSITQAVFPDMLKRAEVLPLFKKGNATNKSTGRLAFYLVSQKIFKGILIHQLKLF